MTAIESPVTITVRPEGVAAWCEACGWVAVRHHRYHRNPEALVLELWAEHWHDTHESER